MSNRISIVSNLNPNQPNQSSLSTCHITSTVDEARVDSKNQFSFTVTGEGGKTKNKPTHDESLRNSG